MKLTQEILEQEKKQVQQDLEKTVNSNKEKGQQGLNEQQKKEFLKKIDLYLLKGEVLKGGPRETHRLVRSGEKNPDNDLVDAARKELMEAGQIELVDEENSIYIFSEKVFNELVGNASQSKIDN